MSGSFVTIGGGFNGHNSVLSVPSSFPSAVNTMLQEYLNSVSSSVIGGTAGFENNDVATGADLVTPGAAALEVISNMDTGGSTAAGSPYNVTVSAGVATLVVEAPGNGTITGSSSTTSVTFGADSNVDYSVQNGAPSSIFAAGGSNNITLLPGIGNLNDTVYSSGNDSLNFLGQGSVQASIIGSANDRVVIEDTQATVTATGNATVGLFWASPTSGGRLDFINNSTAAATIFSSVFNQPDGSALTAPNSITVDGGQGGGYYNGGQAGNNSLIGGTGVVTLVGAGEGDFLQASSSLGQNDLFSGAGSETLEGTSLSGSNEFVAGLNYPGLGQPVPNDVISTTGSGQQNFQLGNGTDTIFGSTVATANVFNIYGDATTGSANFIINNFVNGTIFLNNDADNGAGNASITSILTDPIIAGNNTLITLSDSTQIHLIGVSASSVTQGVDAQGTTFIQ